MSNKEKARLLLRIFNESSQEVQCWLWVAGYDAPTIFREHEESIDIRSFLWESITGQAPGKLREVRTGCGNDRCIRPAHLSLAWVTASGPDDLIAGHAKKLTSAAVASIKKLLQAPYANHRKIALLFGVSRHTIDKISQGKIWTKVKPGGTDERREDGFRTRSARIDRERGFVVVESGGGSAGPA